MAAIRRSRSNRQKNQPAQSRTNQGKNREGQARRSASSRKRKGAANASRSTGRSSGRASTRNANTSQARSVKNASSYRARPTRQTRGARTSNRNQNRNPAMANNRSDKFNLNAQWDAYKQLQKRVDRAWANLQGAVNRRAGAEAIVRAKNELLLLLGECNYMANECMRCAPRTTNNYSSGRNAPRPSFKKRVQRSSSSRWR